MRRCVEARTLLAQLDAELAEAAAATGEQLVWSAAEAQTLKAIAAAVDRKCSLARDYDAASSPSGRVAISGEMRHLEKQITALLKDIRTDLPQPVSAAVSQASRNGTKAANARWTRHRMAKAAEA